MTHPPVRIDHATHRAWHGDTLLRLRTLEYRFLAHLVVRADTCVTRAQVWREVWGTDWIGPSKTLDMHVSQLRRKLGDDAANPAYITTVRGVGWIFNAALAEAPPPPDPESLDLATILRATIAELDDRIEARAAELALPLIANAEQQAAELIAVAEAERQQQEDLVAELRRQLQAAIGRRDQRLPMSQSYVSY